MVKKISMYDIKIISNDIIHVKKSKYGHLLGFNYQIFKKNH